MSSTVKYSKRLFFASSSFSTISLIEFNLLVNLAASKTKNPRPRDILAESKVSTLFILEAALVAVL